MSSVTGADLFDRLPGHYRLLDETSGGAARALLDLVAVQADLVAAQLDELGDAWFIETCPDWAVPYLADLLGVALTHDVDGLVSQRARVANTIRYRRRKGTASVLESLTFDVTGWRTAAVELFERLLTTQHLNHTRTHLTNSVDLRAGDNLEATPGPFAVHAHTVDVRAMTRPGRPPTARPNVASVALHSWRIDARLLPFATAVKLPGPPGGRYRIDPLQRDLPLFNPPMHDRGVDRRTSEDEAPVPLRRRHLREELDRRRDALGAGLADPAPRWAGAGSRPPFELFQVLAPNTDPVPIPATQVQVCRLDPWKGPDPAGKVRVDPVTGRIVVPGPQPLRLLVTAAPGGLDGIGAGPAPRQTTVDDLADDEITWQLGVSRDLAPVANELVATLDDAVDQWNQQPAGTRGVIAVLESHRYNISLTGGSRVRVPEGSELTIVAAEWPELAVPGGAPGQTARRLGVVTTEQVRPCLVGDIDIEGTAPIDSQAAGTLVLDGFLLSGRVRVMGPANRQLGQLTVRSCTQVPADGGITTSGNRRLLDVVVEQSMTGRISLSDSVTRLHVSDSVVDGDAAGAAAIKADGAAVELLAVTALGSVQIRQLEAEDCLFTDAVTAVRRQVGCVRYSYLSPSSTTPRRYRCQPDLALEASDLPDAVVRARLVPAFTSRVPGHHAYPQLADTVAPELRTSAQDGGELGAHNLLRATQRETNALIAVADFLRIGLDAALIHAT
jgi:hypothetical protein